jgi:hypothetical protein
VGDSFTFSGCRRNGCVRCDFSMDSVILFSNCTFQFRNFFRLGTSAIPSVISWPRRCMRKTRPGLSLEFVASPARSVSSVRLVLVFLCIWRTWTSCQSTTTGVEPPKFGTLFLVMYIPHYFCCCLLLVVGCLFCFHASYIVVNDATGFYLFFVSSAVVLRRSFNDTLNLSAGTPSRFGMSTNLRRP